MGFLEIIGKMSFTTIVIRVIGAGLIIGSLLAVLSVRRRSKIVRGFLSAGAFSRDGAKTMSEAGLKDTFLMRLAVREGTVLSRYVVRTELADPDEDGKEPAVPDEKQRKKEKKRSEKDEPPSRYYIPEDKKDEAEIRLVKKAPVYIWAVGAVILAAATEAAVRIVPMISSRF